MNNKMKVLHLLKAREFVMESVLIPKIVEGQALIKFQYGMLCGTDYPKYIDNCLDVSAPLPYGMPLHECVGQVIESKITNLQPSTMVLAMPNNELGLAEYFIASQERIVSLLD